jgi:hypothetical protein
VTAPPPPNPFDRLLEPLRAIIRNEIARLSYLATWEYSVVGVNGDGTVNATPTDDTAGLPALNNLEVRSDPSGSTGAPTPGNTCLVRFINGDPTRPAVVGNQALVKTVTIDASQTVDIGANVSGAVALAGGNAPIARMGDACTVYFPTGATPVAGVVVLAPGTFTGTITFTHPAVGVITSGQPKVVA